LLIRADKAFGLHLDVLGFLICGLIVFASEIRQQGRVEWCEPTAQLFVHERRGFDGGSNGLEVPHGFF